jgi:hypothetical protein
MYLEVKFRKDYSYNWTKVNPVLPAGIPGLEVDTGRFKVGNGDARWADLQYFVPADPAAQPVTVAMLVDHISSETPHPVYDDGPSLELLYQNVKV